jgi:hypothetical protein
MAARTLRTRHSDEIRAKIQASQLINRLTKHALGEVELTATQIRAIEILLKKSVPDLSAVELSGPDGDPVEVVTKIELVSMDGDGQD